jgi:hypothetical protein
VTYLGEEAAELFALPISEGARAVNGMLAPMLKAQGLSDESIDVRTRLTSAIGDGHGRVAVRFLLANDHYRHEMRQKAGLASLGEHGAKAFGHKAYEDDFWGAWALRLQGADVSGIFPAGSDPVDVLASHGRLAAVFAMLMPTEPDDALLEAVEETGPEHIGPLAGLAGVAWYAYKRYGYDPADSILDYSGAIEDVYAFVAEKWKSHGEGYRRVLSSGTVESATPSAASSESIASADDSNNRRLVVSLGGGKTAYLSGETVEGVRIGKIVGRALFTSHRLVTVRPDALDCLLLAGALIPCIGHVPSFGDGWTADVELANALEGIQRNITATLVDIVWALHRPRLFRASPSVETLLKAYRAQVNGRLPEIVGALSTTVQNIARDTEHWAFEGLNVDGWHPAKKAMAEHLALSSLTRVELIIRARRLDDYGSFKKKVSGPIPVNAYSDHLKDHLRPFAQVYALDSSAAPPEHPPMLLEGYVCSANDGSVFVGTFEREYLAEGRMLGAPSDRQRNLRRMLASGLYPLRPGEKLAEDGVLHLPRIGN